MIPLTPELLLEAYGRGIFPMAESREDPTLYWVDPDRRGILPFEDFHVSRRLLRKVRQDVFKVSADRAFRDVIGSCASPAPGRWTTWINDRIEALYCELHERGNAHSVECWCEGELAGGLYGVSIGGAFFGESMFSRKSDASKVALVHLVARLVQGGYRLLDIQFVTQHLAHFGVVEVSRSRYRKLLKRAMTVEGDFYSLSEETSGAEVLQSITHTS